MIFSWGTSYTGQDIHPNAGSFSGLGSALAALFTILPWKVAQGRK